LAVLAIAGCNLIKKAGGGDAGDTATTADLPPDCETFLTRYSCFLTKNGQPTAASDEMRSQWMKNLAVAPATRDGVATTCKTQLATQAAAFDKAGCTSSAAASASAASSAPAASAPKKTGTTTNAAKKVSVPTCKPGEALVTLAMSPFSPECAPKCETDADCKVERCLEADPIDENGGLKNGPLVKVCNREYLRPPKCNAGEWLDTDYNKCRPNGQCAPGKYRWDDTKKKCVYVTSRRRRPS
jgi:hypothetical protein